MSTSHLTLQNHTHSSQELTLLNDYFFLTLDLLRLSSAELKDFKMNVALNYPHSFCDEKGIYIQSTTDKGGLTSTHWLELLFKHELTHFLTAKFWGMPPSLFFEGLAVFISDMDIKARELGQSYHQKARALIQTSHYIPFSAITYSHHYLGRRNDFRCDVQAGSFIAFLIERFDLASIRRVYEKSKVPTRADPSLNIHEVCKEVCGHNLYELEVDWHEWLESHFSVSREDVLKLENFVGYNNKLRVRCPFCLAPECQCLESA